jgi:hypothetical protein
VGVAVVRGTGSLVFFDACIDPARSRHCLNAKTTCYVLDVRKYACKQEGTSEGRNEQRRLPTPVSFASRRIYLYRFKHCFSCPARRPNPSYGVYSNYTVAVTNDRKGRRNTPRSAHPSAPRRIHPPRPISHHHVTSPTQLIPGSSSKYVLETQCKLIPLPPPPSTVSLHFPNPQRHVPRLACHRTFCGPSRKNPFFSGSAKRGGGEVGGGDVGVGEHVGRRLCWMMIGVRGRILGLINGQTQNNADM